MIYEYDGTKEKCPIPLVNMRLILKKMKSDDQCLIRLIDPSSIKDISALLTKQLYPYSQRLIGDGIVEICITNKKI
jgi:TusA-related sulfurtransferase